MNTGKNFPRTGSRRARVRGLRRLAVPAIAIALAAAASAPSAEREVVSTARQGRATPWVSVHAAANSVVVPFSDIPMVAGVPQRTTYYEIDDEVVESGYFYYYYVRGKRNDYLVESTAHLFRLLHELAVLEELAKHDPAGEFFAGVGRSVQGIGLGVGNLVTKPGQTIRNVGAGIGRMFKSHPHAGHDEKGEDRGLEGSGPAGEQRRNLAYKFHLDVYTNNPEVRHVLNVMGRARLTGVFATWAIPYSEVGIFSAASLRDDNTDQLIRDLEPDALRAEIGKRLEPVFGQSRKDAGSALGRFIRNPNYTPRQIAYGGKCLGDLAGAGNLDMILDLLAQVDCPETADLAYLDLRVHHMMHTRVQPIAGFVELLNIVAAQGANGEFYFIFPGDVMSNWSVSPEEIDDLIEEANGHRATALKVLALGVVKPEFAEMLQQRGLQVFQNVMRDPRFFSEDY